MNYKLLRFDFDKKTKRQLVPIVIPIFGLFVFSIFVIYTGNEIILSSLFSVSKTQLNQYANTKPINSSNQTQTQNGESSESTEMMFTDEPLTTTPHTETVTNITLLKSIIDLARVEVALEMKHFKYTEEMINLSSLTPETDGKPIRSGKC